MSRVFGAVVGGAIGVAAGGIMDGTVGQRFRNEGDSPAKGLLTAPARAASARGHGGYDDLRSRVTRRRGICTYRASAAYRAC